MTLGLVCSGKQAADLLFVHHLYTKDGWYWDSLWGKHGAWRSSNDNSLLQDGKKLAFQRKIVFHSFLFDGNNSGAEISNQGCDVIPAFLNNG